MAKAGGFKEVKVKICGNTNAEDAKLAAKLGADYLGFIFTKSKRKVDVRNATAIVQALPQFKNFVGVFANQPKKEVEATARDLGLRILQFHGDETALYCQYFMDHDYEIIKSFRIKDAMSLKRIDEYNVTAFLFDAYSKEEFGGTGRTFDWNLIANKPFVHDRLFLAGGLNIHNLPNAIDQIHPYAVDVASGVEKYPGKKDPELLEKFIRIAKEGIKQDAQKGSVRT